MLNKDSNINAGNSSTNNQAQTINNTYNGITYSDARDIAIDVFKNNFLVLKDEAAAVASERAYQITEKFLKRLESEAPHALSEFATPGMQDTFFHAQKDFALSGDDEIAEMLVQILIERAQTPIKNRMRLVLDESMKIASKLTADQMDLLTLTHLMHRSIEANVGTFENLIKRISRNLSICENLSEIYINEDLQFLEYLRLGKFLSGKYFDPCRTWLTSYGPYLNKGFTHEELHVPEIPNGDLFIICFHDTTKVQFRFETKEALITFLRSENLTEERINHISSFFNHNLFQQEEFNQLLNDKIGNYSKMITIHNNTEWNSFDLSSVGIAIALSNYYRRFGNKVDMSIWIK